MQSQIDILVRTAGVAVGAAFLVIAALRFARPWRGHLLLLVGCAIGYLVCSAPLQPCCDSAAGLPVLLAAAAFPFAFWRFARAALQDDGSVPPQAWLGLATLLATGFVAAADYAQAPVGWRAAAGALNKVAAFAFVGAALVALWRSWDGDLVEPRRRLRWLLLGYVGIYGSAILIAETFLAGARPPAWLDLANAAAIGLSLLVTLAYLVQPSTRAVDALFAPASVPPPVAASSAAASDADAPLLARLRDLMETQQLYREPDLAVATLASRAGIPEYVLRRLIHDRLGHRNFAAYVNEHRLREVAERLKDPALARRPILTLALEAGFGSIGPFNRAFRDRFGVTPSEYRAGEAVRAA